MTATCDLTINPDLPIAAAAGEIAAAILGNQVVIVAGETGSGKTTQLPKIAMLAGRERIGHTQPRRIAARTLAERIAEETRTEVGDVVGYQVRFTRKTGRSTAVKVMTDGILLAEITGDRLLRKYDTIIIDEAHERSLNIDFLLGYLKQLLPRRPDLKVIVTSATIDTARFSAHFAGAPIVTVEGRTYPVDVYYRDDDDREQSDAICDAVGELVDEGPGDILVFLSGEREIRDTADAINAMDLRFTEVLPLYARLSAAEQHRVFAPHTGRRVVLATNVAETSITVPGIRYVIDPGTARISRYSKRTKVQRLPIEPVSRASANQRAGRCGRVAPGICIRLYSEADFASRPEFTEPEILRTNLASVILQMAEAGLGDIASFPFVEPPDAAQITDGLRLLDELGALEPGSRHNPRLTTVGHSLARLPVDPRLARMLVEADRLGCLREVQVVVSALAIPDVRDRPAEKREQADLLHRRFWAGTPDDPTPASDFVAVLRLWEHLRTRRRELSGSAFRRMCRDEYLNFLRVREWQDLHTQLRGMCDDLGMTRNEAPAGQDRIHTAILSGLLSHIGLLDTRDDKPDVPARKRARSGPREYLGARGSRFAINPGSGLFRTPPPLVMAFELVETTRLWARTVAGIEAASVEEVGEHVIKRQYSEPHWAESTGSVVASETASVYGVPIIAGRLVSYARIDPVEARRIFIQSALVEGRWRTRHHFYARNQATRAEAEALEERTRRRDLIVDDAAIYAFYDERVPADVVSVAHFDTWWRKQRHIEDGHLDLTLDDLIDPAADEIDAAGFPETWRVAGRDLDITYIFDLGSGSDGVTVTIPLGVLNQVPAEPFSWQVPGLRAELATELIRSLPKAVRTKFVPAPNFAAGALAWLRERPDVASRPAGDTAPDTIAFRDALSRALVAMTGDATTDAWGDVPGHLQITFVVEDAGREVGRGADVAELRRTLAPTLSRTLTKANLDRTATGATSWTFGRVEERLVTRRGSTDVIGFPAVSDEAKSVGVTVLDSEARARGTHARGVRRLVLLVSPDPTNWVVGHMSNATKLALGTSPYPDIKALLADARAKAVDRALAEVAGDTWSVRDPERFAVVLVGVRERVPGEMRAIVTTAGEVLQRAQRVRGLLADLPSSGATLDVTEQLANLVFGGFVAATADPYYGHLPRYLHAMEVRLEAYRANPAREGQSADLVADLEDEYARLCSAQPPGPLPRAVERVGWLLEELRVSLFAQTLRTAEPVSAKRVRQAMAGGSVT